jgi:hypothetical protein
MNSIKTVLLGVAATATFLTPVADSRAWVAAGAGWGGHGAVAVGGYHGGYYHGGGCWGCGAAVGAVAGMAVGAAIATAARPAPVVVAPPPYYPPPTPYYPQGNLELGTQVAALPPGSNNMVVNGQQYYQSGATWYKPYYGSSGVYYQVVPAP